MKKIAYIVAHWSQYSKEFQYAVQGYAPSSDNGYVLLEAREIEFDTPNDTTLRTQIAQALREKKNKVLADAHVEAKQIDEEIQELLALEDKTGQVVAPAQSDDIPF